MCDERTARASGDTEGEPGMETPEDPPRHQRTAKALTFTERPPPGHDVDDAQPLSLGCGKFREADRTVGF